MADSTQHEERTSRELSILLDDLLKSLSPFIKSLKQIRISHEGDPPLKMSLRARLTSSATGFETNVKQGCEVDRHPSKN